METITNTITEYVLQKQAEGTRRWLERKRAYGEPKLNASDVGHCSRKAYWNAFRAWPEHPLHQPITHPYDLYTEDVMFSGSVWEDVLEPALIAKGGIADYQVITEHWGGEIDVLLRRKSEWQVIELKDSAEHNFEYRNRLPYRFHCGQALTYQRLLAEQERLDPEDVECSIYYHGRGHQAEFAVWATNGYLVYEGQVDGNTRSGEFNFDLEGEIHTLEAYWLNQQLPPAYHDPFEVSFGECVKGSAKKGYYPGCVYWGSCWSSLPQRGPFSKEDCGCLD